MQDTHHTIATHENVKFCVMSSLELLQDVIPIKSLICIVCSGGLDADGLGFFIGQYGCSSCFTAMCTKLGASASLMRCRLDLGGLETTFGSLSLRVCSVCMT